MITESTGIALSSHILVCFIHFQNALPEVEYLWCVLYTFKMLHLKWNISGVQGIIYL